MTSTPLLSITHLSISFFQRGTKVEAVRDISFSICKGERVGIVGESGSGKSCTIQAIPRLLSSAQISGAIHFEGRDLLQCNEQTLQQVRGKKIGVAFQETGTSLNPTMTIGKQIEEVLICHGLPLQRTLELLTQVELPSHIYHRYPHELSGGMKQRALFAIAIACHPTLLIADEPTTALDPKTKEQMLSLLKQKELSSTLLLVSHDLHLVASVCDRILIFHQGQLIEEGTTAKITTAPQHPYTQMLLTFL